MKASKISFISVLITVISFISQINLIFDTFLSVYGVIYKKYQDYLSVYFLLSRVLYCAYGIISLVYISMC